MPRVMDRIGMLQQFIAQSPNDPFPRYGLALEYKNTGRLDEAREQFAQLLAAFPDYTAAYLHAGNTLVSLGQRAEARLVYEQGLVACARKGDQHARSELAAALADLGEP
jgi:tetratricopeptide (TPR) repeat protein